jgi:hypothetical protein
MADPLYLRHHGVEQFGLFAGGGIDPAIQCVAQGHQLVYFDDNAVLFVSGWQRD